MRHGIEFCAPRLCASCGWAELNLPVSALLLGGIGSAGKTLWPWYPTWRVGAGISADGLALALGGKDNIEIKAAMQHWVSRVNATEVMYLLGDSSPVTLVFVASYDRNQRGRARDRKAMCKQKSYSADWHSDCTPIEYIGLRPAEFGKETSKANHSCTRKMTACKNVRSVLESYRDDEDEDVNFVVFLFFFFFFFFFIPKRFKVHEGRVCIVSTH